MGREVSVWFCPECESLDVGYLFAFRTWFGLNPMIRCNNCLYTAPVFPVLQVEKDMLSKKSMEVTC